MYWDEALLEGHENWKGVNLNHDCSTGTTVREIRLGYMGRLVAVLIEKTWRLVLGSVGKEEANES